MTALKPTIENYKDKNEQAQRVNSLLPKLDCVSDEQRGYAESCRRKVLRKLEQYGASDDVLSKAEKSVTDPDYWINWAQCHPKNIISEIKHSIKDKRDKK